MDDIIETLRIQEPISITGLGSLSWLPIHHTKKLMDQAWTTRYAVPSPSIYPKCQDFGLKLVLNEPFKTSGSGRVDITVNYILNKTKIFYTADEEQGLSMDRLSKFVVALQSILLKLHGVELSCYNGCVDDDNPLEVIIELKGCKTEGIKRNDLLRLIASYLTLEMSGN